MTKENMNGATFSHEIVAIEEAKIGVFFAAVAIQLLLTPKMLRMKNISPMYLEKNGNVEICAAQRVFVQKIIDSPELRDVREEFEFFIGQYAIDSSIEPEKIFLNSINKSFLIRQIFKKTAQVLPKYNFIEDYIGIPLREFKWDKLSEDMSILPIEQKILVLARIFDRTGDTVGRNKTIIGSLIENSRRNISLLEKKGITNSQEYVNLKLFLEFENKFGFL